VFTLDRFIPVPASRRPARSRNGQLARSVVACRAVASGKCAPCCQRCAALVSAAVAGWMMAGGRVPSAEVLVGQPSPVAVASSSALSFTVGSSPTGRTGYIDGAGARDSHWRRLADQDLRGGTRPPAIIQPATASDTNAAQRWQHGAHLPEATARQATTSGPAGRPTPGWATARGNRDEAIEREHWAETLRRDVSSLRFKPFQRRSRGVARHADSRPDSPAGTCCAFQKAF